MKSKIEKSGALCLLAFVMLSFTGFLPEGVFAEEKIFRNSIGMEFVLIPAGTFTMGSPPAEPHRNKDEIQHQVTISKPFYIQSTEVTLKQWWALMGKRLFGKRKGTPDTPVTRVSWHDSMDFIEKLNALNEGKYRLPTEAEWEYACRAGTTTPYSWGGEIDCSQAMYGNNSFKSEECIEFLKKKGFAIDRPAVVKSYPPNPWGLYDMHGNLWEWCQDWYGAYPKGPVVDPRGADSGETRIRRSGSWFKRGHLCRSANRFSAYPGSRFRNTGFRVVREAQ